MEVIDDHSKGRACKSILVAENVEDAKTAAEAMFAGFGLRGEFDRINIFHLRYGGAASISRTARSMFRKGEVNTQVLDVAIEVLLDRYKTTGEETVDALSWIMRALGRSGNGRYYDALVEVSKTDNFNKLRDYAEAAIKVIGPRESVHYRRGMIDLNAE